MQNSGFSLLELLVIICISAIMISIGISHWKALHLRNELMTTTKQLAYFLNEAQFKAYTNNKTYNIYLFLSPWCLSISEGERPTTCNQGEFQFIKPNNSVTISGLTDKKTLAFWGRRNMAQTASFQLKNETGETKVLISFRGRVRFCHQKSYLSGLPPC
jgi:prepilin peptidase dependent protein A